MRRLSYVFIIVIFLSGCASSPPSRFYLLDGQTSSAEVWTKKIDRKFAVGPVTVAGYLSRPQMVTRLTETQVELSEFNRWAEPLKSNIQQVLIDNLASHFPHSRFYKYPTQRGTVVNYRVAVNVSRFDTTKNGVSVLQATVSIFSGSDKVASRHFSTRLTSLVNGKFSYAAAVIAMNANLAKLSQFIAKQLIR